ncbi:hypothetical protein DNFV4_04558 [Nitrospira tepida]|uniref:Uncharacterized protein n=1 Tax=Nitrospira tepida TaxID=2973512 RepID=A0AA86TFY1_9BACT|nr:hypothetical protein [Nitrospira tepida]CAI4034114.1 hypothetical protein DNFV4_04558 [Nitrospira tepida]
MSEKEATARIKINKLLEAAGWRFFRDGSGPANIRLEPTGGTSGVRSCFVRVDELDSVTWCVRLALHFRGRCINVGVRHEY